MMQHNQPDDYVVATGIGATVREFCEISFSEAGLNWEEYVILDESYIRPTEVDALIGDSSKIERELGWKATTYWKDLAKLMVNADIANLKK
jgi:GDPmannose 4,6-dehydratase